MIPKSAKATKTDDRTGIIQTVGVGVPSRQGITSEVGILNELKLQLDQAEESTSYYMTI